MVLGKYSRKWSYKILPLLHLQHKKIDIQHLQNRATSPNCFGVLLFLENDENCAHFHNFLLTTVSSRRPQPSVACGSKSRSPIISSPFRFRSEERVAKRKEARPRFNHSYLSVFMPMRMSLC